LFICLNKVLNGISFVQSAGCIINHFSDSGIFGLKISGDYENVNRKKN